MADEEARNRSTNGEEVAVKDGAKDVAAPANEGTPAEEATKKGEVTLSTKEKILYWLYSDVEKEAFLLEKTQKQRNKKAGNENTVANPHPSQGFRKLFQSCFRKTTEKNSETEEQRSESDKNKKEAADEGKEQSKNAEQKEESAASSPPPAAAAENAQPAPTSDEKTAETAESEETPAAAEEKTN